MTAKTHEQERADVGAEAGNIDVGGRGLDRRPSIDIAAGGVEG